MVVLRAAEGGALASTAKAGQSGGSWGGGRASRGARVVQANVTAPRAPRRLLPCARLVQQRRLERRDRAARAHVRAAAEHNLLRDLLVDALAPAAAHPAAVERAVADLLEREVLGEEHEVGRGVGARGRALGAQRDEGVGLDDNEGADDGGRVCSWWCGGEAPRACNLPKQI